MAASDVEVLKEELRGLWQFGSIMQFATLFKQDLKLPPFTGQVRKDGNGNPTTSFF
jgi:hypothetical protein